jgi:hypothetical protein
MTPVKQPFDMSDVQHWIDQNVWPKHWQALSMDDQALCREEILRRLNAYYVLTHS